jgi:hypothetical protein
VGALSIRIIASTIINPAGPDGLLYVNPMQLAVQGFIVAVAAALGFGGTIVIMKVIDATMGLGQGGGGGGRGRRHQTRHYTRSSVRQLTLFFLSPIL